MKRIKNFISILLIVAMIMPFLVTALPSNVYADSTTQETLSSLAVDTGYASHNSTITVTRTSDIINLTKALRLKVSSSHYVDNIKSYASASSWVTIQIFNTAGTQLTSKTLSGSNGTTKSEYMDLSNVSGEGYIKITATAPNCDSDNGTRVVFGAPVLYLSANPEFNTNSYVQSNGNLTRPCAYIVFV